MSGDGGRTSSARLFATLSNRRGEEADLARAFLEAIEGDLTTARLVVGTRAATATDPRLQSQARILEGVIAKQDAFTRCKTHLLEWPADDLVLIFTAVFVGFSGADDRHETMYDLMTSLPLDGLSSIGLLRLAHAAIDVDEHEAACGAISRAKRADADADDWVHAEIHALEAANDLGAAHSRLRDYLRARSADDFEQEAHLLAHLAFLEAELELPSRAVSDFLTRASDRLARPGSSAQLALDYLLCTATGMGDRAGSHPATLCRELSVTDSRTPPLWALGAVICAATGRRCGYVHPLPRPGTLYASASTVDAVLELVSGERVERTRSSQLHCRLGGSRSEYGRVFRKHRATGRAHLPCA
jgi:hypothetical protein